MVRVQTTWNALIATLRMPKFTINHGKKILEDRKINGMVPLVVEHDVHEYEIDINSEWCDIGSHKVPEWSIRIIQDTAVCEGCFEHYN